VELHALTHNTLASNTVPSRKFTDVMETAQSLHAPNKTFTGEGLCELVKDLPIYDVTFVVQMRLR